MKQARSKNLPRRNSDEDINLSLILQGEFDRFIHTIESTVRHIQKNYPKES